MADWYVSSAAYAAIPQFAPNTAYTVGQIIRPLAAPNAWQMHPQRVTSAGTSAASEPGWQASNNATTNSGTATFTNVSGQSAYGWGAAAGNLLSLSNFNWNRPAAGDRLFVSSDHSESFSGGTTWSFANAGFGVIQFLSVNRAGSVPPVAGDLLAGASLTTTGGNLILETLTNVYWHGFTFTLAGANTFFFNSSGVKTACFKNCALAITSSSTSPRYQIQAPIKLILDNTTIQFGNSSQTFQNNTTNWDFIWLNTPSALKGTMPTSLLTAPGNLTMLITARGVDLSAFSGTFLSINTTSYTATKTLLDSCKIASAMTRLGPSTNNSSSFDEVELVNCFDGASVLNERYTTAGAVTVDRSTTMASGAADDNGAYSLKLVSSAGSNIAASPLESFWLDVENTAIGSPKTAIIQIISSSVLNNNDIKLQLEYMGTSGSSIANFTESLASTLTPVAPLPSSSVTWNSPPSTPQKQLLQVSFTPQAAGRVRGLVQLGKTSTTVWINPQIIIT